MPYGRIKVDNISFTDGGADKDISISGLVKNPTFTGNVTATGTISGDVLRGGTTVSGATVTGTTANFVSGNFSTQISGAIIKAPAGSAAAPTVQVGTGASIPPGFYGAATDELGISTGGASRVVVGSAGQIKVINGGSASAPSLVVNNDVDTGLYGPASNEIAITTSGIEKLRINASGAIGISGANYGASGQILTSNGPSGAPSWQNTTTAVNVQQFTSNGTWTKPAGITYVLVEIWGGGGGGSSGARGPAASGRAGGAGGGGGAYLERTFMATGLTSTVSVTVGAGGTGGAAVTANDTLGNIGADGGTSTFGSYISGRGGAGGRVAVSFGGDSSFGIGASALSGVSQASPPIYDGANGGSASLSSIVGSGGSSSFFGGGGGAGGNGVLSNNRCYGYSSEGGISINGSGGRGGIARDLSTLSNNNIERKTAYGNGMYVMQAQPGWLISSTNLSTWTTYAVNAFTQVYSLLHDGSKWVAMAAGNPNIGGSYGIYTSTDLSTWTLQSTVSNDARKITYNSGTYVVVGANSLILSSTDLITWTTRTASGSHYDIIHDGSRWITGSTNPLSSSGLVYTSTDAATWTAGGLVAGFAFNRIASNGAGTLVAANTTANIRYSTDTGTTWSTGVAVSGNSSLLGLIYAESKFVRAVSGFINTSADGITWTNSASGTTYWESVVYNGTDFFAAATATGTVATGTTIIGNGSTDATTWSGALTWTPYLSSGEPGTNGSGYSAGGGGGGASQNGYNSGAGGNGVDGFVRVTSW